MLPNVMRRLVVQSSKARTRASGGEWRPLYSMVDLVDDGPILIVAPHPDDETIGCGGLISLAAAAHIDVRIVVLTDGSLSHPHSKTFPSDLLAALRQRECVEACAVLGVAAGKIIFHAAKDGFLRCSDDAVELIQNLLNAVRPTCVFTTWIDDPHCDYKAAFEIVRSAVARSGGGTRFYAYPIWSWKIRVARNPLESAVFRLAMGPVVDRKMQAVARHRSQLGKVVLDDPGGTFNEQDLMQIRRTAETFIEVVS